MPKSKAGLVAELNDQTLGAYLAESAAPSLLCFHASWSRPARTLLPIIEDLAVEYEKLVRFANVDAKHAPLAIDRYGILTLPAALFMRGSRIVDRFTGLHGRDHIVERIERNLQKM